MWENIFNHYTLFLMVFVRMTGALLFNPILGRKAVPAMMKIGFAFLCAVIMMGIVPNGDIQFVGTFDFILICMKELLIGFAVSFVISLFLSVAVVSGEMIDVQLGMAMSKIYDPQSNLNLSATGNLFNLMFIMIFFLSNSHLTLVKIIYLSFRILPPGPELINFQFGQSIGLLFAQILVLAIKIALPIIAIEMISEFGLGILMRTVPQLNVFVVGLPLKLLIGLIIVTMILPNVANIFDSLLNSMFVQIGDTLNLMA